jgi:SMI1 / KNR4 family (SUKH-1)
LDRSAFDQVVTRMAASGVALSRDVRGCTDAEIAALEQRYGVLLPKSYRWFLATMGHASGRLFTSDHIAASYPHVFAITADLRARLAGYRPDDRFDTPRPVGFQLPPDAFFIASRLASQWQFIRCNDGYESPVWMFRDGDWTVRQTHSSVTAWLQGWCEAAEAAIASGYFEQNPRGTAP